MGRALQRASPPLSGRPSCSGCTDDRLPRRAPVHQPARGGARGPGRHSDDGSDRQFRSGTCRSSQHPGPRDAGSGPLPPARRPDARPHRRRPRGLVPRGRPGRPADPRPRRALPRRRLGNPGRPGPGGSLAGFGLGLGLAAPLLFALQTAPDLWATPACDALSPPWLWLATGGLATALVASLSIG